MELSKQEAHVCVLAIKHWKIETTGDSLDQAIPSLELIRQTRNKLAEYVRAPEEPAQEADQE